MLKYVNFSSGLSPTPVDMSLVGEESQQHDTGGEHTQSQSQSSQPHQTKEAEDSKKSKCLVPELVTLPVHNNTPVNPTAPLPQSKPKPGIDSGKAGVTGQVQTKDGVKHGSEAG
jgi:hypothetical protein